MKLYFFIFYKTTYLNEEINRFDPSPSVRLPCTRLLFMGYDSGQFFHTFFYTTEAAAVRVCPCQGFLVSQIFRVKPAIAEQLTVDHPMKTPVLPWL